jgi:hypothetical protein
MPDDLEYPAPDGELSASGRADPVGSEFLLREGSQARAGSSYSLSERLRRREAYHADDTARRTPRPRDRAVTTSHKIAEAMTEFVGPDGRTYAAIPMDLYAEVAEEEQEVPEEEYDAEAAFAAWTQLTEEQRIAQIEQAQAALDTLPGNDRAIMERIVLVAGNARAGLKTAAQRTRQYFTAGDQIIAQGQQHGATFTTESFEALLFAMDDTLKSRPSITSTQLEECDAVVLGHMAVLTTSGTPIMPDSFADSGNIFRTPVQSVGRFGIMTRDLDSEGNVRAGPWLWRNFRVAWRRYGPLVLLGLGWTWNPIYTRAEVLREMMTGTGAPRYGNRIRKDPAVSDRIQRAWEMRLAGASYRDIHDAVHLYDSSKYYSTFFSTHSTLAYLTMAASAIPQPGRPVTVSASPLSPSSNSTQFATEHAHGRSVVAQALTSIRAIASRAIFSPDSPFAGSALSAAKKSHLPAGRIRAAQPSVHIGVVASSACVALHALCAQFLAGSWRRPSWSASPERSSVPSTSALRSRGRMLFSPNAVETGSDNWVCLRRPRREHGRRLITSRVSSRPMAAIP